MSNTEQPLFRDGETVKHRSTGEFGVVRGETSRTAGEYWYRVQFSQRKERMVEDDLESLSQAPTTLREVAAAGTWGRLASFRSALTIERIGTKNRSTVYAFRSQRISTSRSSRSSTLVTVVFSSPTKWGSERPSRPA